MKNLRALKYLPAFFLPLLAGISFYFHDWRSYMPVIYAFVIVPLTELFTGTDTSNFDTDDNEEVTTYDWLIYLIIPVHYFLVISFLKLPWQQLSIAATAGHILSCGLLCGVIGINVAHELGHRKRGYEKFLAKTLLLTSLYMHFFIEHNRGHHSRVGTPGDPATAKRGESLYRFWIKTLVFSYWSAWQLEAERLSKKKLKFMSVHNEMIIFHFIQAAALIAIYMIYGMPSLLAFLLAALSGILLLETVNYIEHYGLYRNMNGPGFEKVMRHHSWNSNHKIGRLMLFELSRHSDHHYKASRKYYLLKHWDDAPQMPAGYPGMMILALIPPLWFAVMNPRLTSTATASG